MACIFCKDQLVCKFYSPSYFYSCFECDFNKNNFHSSLNKYCQNKPCKFCNNRNTKINKIFITSCIKCAKNYNLEYNLYFKENNLIIKYIASSKDTLGVFKNKYRFNGQIKNNLTNFNDSEINYNLLDLGFLPNTEFILEK